MEWYENMTKKELYDKWIYFEQRQKIHEAEANYYQEELQKAHTLLGRIVHQTSERWDTINLTKYFPTDNLHNRRTVGNPTGKKID